MPRRIDGQFRIRLPGASDSDRDRHGETGWQPPPMSDVSVSAIVVNHNQAGLLRACLATLTRALDQVGEETELVVVDNGSTDSSRDLVRSEHPDAALVLLPENRGFAAAVSEGVRHSRGSWLLLLNNDTTVQCDAVRELLAVGRTSGDVGAVAAQLRFAGTSTVNSAGIAVDRLGVAHANLMGAAGGGPDSPVVEVFGASGGAALYRRAMLHDVGGFDESFFMYGEDADLAWRARMRGWRALYAPAAVVDHHHSATARHGSPFKHFHVGLNRVRILAKNAELSLLLRHGPAMVAYDLAYVGFAVLTDRTLAPLRGRLRGLRQWRAYRRAGAGRRPAALAPSGGVLAALRRWSSARSAGAGRRLGRGRAATSRVR